jgi:cell filamentation protein
MANRSLVAKGLIWDLNISTISFPSTAFSIKNTGKEIANKLAEILDTVNYLHPFREGNGRTQREFLRLLALDKGLTLNLNPPDNKDVYERYMKGTINSDLSVLSDLIFELIEAAN